MEYLNDILCISYTELTHGEPNNKDVINMPIMSESNYRKVHKKLNLIRRACYGTPALIEYNSLPTRFKEKVIVKYGDPEKNVKNIFLRDLIVKDLRAEESFRRHTFGEKGSKGLDLETQKEYTMNASVLNAIGQLFSDRTLMVRALGGSTKYIWKNISDALNRIQVENGCKLPRNPQSLKRVLLKYQEFGYSSLISGKYGNNHARRAKEAEQEALIVELLGDGRNIDNETIAKLYNAVAERMGWKTVSGSTIANYKNEHPECFAGRHGKKALSNEKLMQVRRYAPTCPMFFWCVDGWDTELLYQRTAKNKEGHSVTTYHHRPTVVAIVDPFNKYIIGYAIGTHETPELIRQAFRNAFEHVNEILGGYFKPWELQTDNYGNGALKSFYTSCTKYYIPAKAGNAKAKMIEPFFNWFNRKYIRLLPNSSGFGVKSRKAIQPSDDWIESHKRRFPDYYGCCAQLEQMIAFDRRMKQADFLKSWGEMPKEKQLPFEKIDFLSTFGEVTERPHKLHGDGIRLRIDNQKFYYDSFDGEFRQYGHITFFLRYDPSNMDNILAVENVGTKQEPKEGTVRFLLERKYEQPMALMDRKPGDMEELMRIRNHNDNMVEDIILKRTKSAETVQAFFEENDDLLRDTLTKHVITDSLGQHKNRRNKVAGRTEPIPIPAKMKGVLIEDDFEFAMDEQDCYSDF